MFMKASGVEKQVKLQFATKISQIGVLVRILLTPHSVQLPANALGKAAGNGPNIWTPVTALVAQARELNVALPIWGVNVQIQEIFLVVLFFSLTHCLSNNRIFAERNVYECFGGQIMMYDSNLKEGGVQNPQDNQDSEVIFHLLQSRDMPVQRVSFWNKNIKLRSVQSRDMHTLGMGYSGNSFFVKSQKLSMRIAIFINQNILTLLSNICCSLIYLQINVSQKIFYTWF